MNEEGVGIKVRSGRDEFKYDVVDTLQQPLQMPQWNPTHHTHKKKYTQSKHLLDLGKFFVNMYFSLQMRKE
jgi:hypothetical protein